MPTGCVLNRHEICWGGPHNWDTPSQTGFGLDTLPSVPHCDRPLSAHARGISHWGRCAYPGQWDFATTEIPNDQRILSKIERCSTKLPPAKNPETAIRLTAVYIPPPKVKLLKMEVLEKLNEPITDPDTHTVSPHVLGGDFNTTGWKRLYEEWLRKTGTMDLVYPQMPTYAGGQQSTSSCSFLAPIYPLPCRPIPTGPATSFAAAKMPPSTQPR